MSGAGASSLSRALTAAARSRGLSHIAVWLVVATDVLVALGVLVYSHTAGANAQTSGLIGDVVILAVVVSFALVGGLVAWRLPANVVAWLLLAVATSAAGLWWLPGGWVPPIGILGMHLLLCFPDGRLPSPRWRWFSWAAVVLIVVLTFVTTAADPTLSTGEVNPYYVPWAIDLGPALVLFPIFILTSAVSLRIRFRRAGVVEREQIRWVAWAGGFIGVLYSITLILSTVFDTAQSNTWGQVSADDVALPTVELLALLSFVLLPVSIGIAVLRYRLFDIDRLISRTASYLVVTGMVVAVYAVAVTFATRLLPASSSLAVAAATLTAAAAFRPALGRVQATVDRRFDRRRYDAARVVEEFGAHLRDVVDPDDIVRQLEAAVSATIQPDGVALWMPD